MKIVEYILKFGFMFGVSIALPLSISPLFINNATKSIGNYELVKEIEFNNAFNSSDYMALKVTTFSNKKYKKKLLFTRKKTL